MNHFIVILTAIITTLLALVYIPRAIRTCDDGIYKGFNDARIPVYFILYALLQFVVIVSRMGPGLEAILRTFITSCIPFVTAYFWVRFTDKTGANIDYQIRKHDEIF